MTTDQELGGFVLERKIGSGGMATVYLALQRSLDRRVVVKVLHPHLAEDAALVARFEREARTAAQLKHENIVQVIDCGRSGSTSYIAMEFVEGRNLRELCDAGGPPPLPITVLLLRDIARGLEHAHARKVIHRDIKPANLMLTAGGTLKIMDFGLARLEDEGGAAMTATGSIMGTPAYMSPEQAEGHPVDERTDLFSLGVVGYELLSGRRPFAGESYASVIRALLSVEPAPLSSALPDIPPELAALVHRMLAKDPAGRPAGASSIRAELDTLALSLGLHRGQDLLREYAQKPVGRPPNAAMDAPEEPADDLATVVRRPKEVRIVASGEETARALQDSAAGGARLEAHPSGEASGADRLTGDAQAETGPFGSDRETAAARPGHARPGRRMRNLLWIAAALVVVTTGGILWKTQRHPSATGHEGIPLSQTGGLTETGASPPGRTVSPGAGGSVTDGSDAGGADPGRVDAGRADAGRADAGRSDAGRSNVGRSGVAGTPNGVVSDGRGPQTPDPSATTPPNPPQSPAGRTDDALESGAAARIPGHIEEARPPSAVRAAGVKFRIGVKPKPALIFVDGSKSPMNSDGSTSFVTELKPGPHVFRTVNEALAIDRSFRYQVAPNDSNNQLLLDVNTGDVQPSHSEEVPF